MSGSEQELGQFHFLSWTRRGFGANLTNPDPLSGSIPYRGSLDVSLQVETESVGGSSMQPYNYAGSDQTLSSPQKTVNMYGPIDVKGIDKRQVFKTEPPDGTLNFEPNYFAGIEFTDPDFPWILTPAAPSSNVSKNPNSLRPWLVLIVLKSDPAPAEFDSFDLSAKPQPVVSVIDLAKLPDLAESWGWVHVQISGSDSDISTAISNNPKQVISRILCPRQLSSKTSYTAFLVPAFASGVQTGLGTQVQIQNGTLDEPAWQLKDNLGHAVHGPIKLPVYYSFKFSTSDQGDFESLARKLKPLTSPPDVGLRPIDVSDVGWGLPPATTDTPPVLEIGGAMRTIETVSDWSSGKLTFQNSLTTLLNEAADPFSDDPTNPNPNDPYVGPPIYGRWHALVQKIDPTTPVVWLDDLNLDPRFRAAAGLGTQVVLQQRSQLMASAWKQYDGLQLANQLLRYGQFARSGSQMIYSKNFLNLAPEALLPITLQVHGRIANGSNTVRAAVINSQFPVRALSGTFRRIIRPLGPIRRRQGTAITSLHYGIITRLNATTILPKVNLPGGLVPLDAVSDELFQRKVPDWLLSILEYLDWIIIGVAAVADILLLVFGSLGGWLPQAIAASSAIAGAAFAAIRRFKKIEDKAKVSHSMRFSNITPQAFSQILPQPTFQVTKAGQPMQPVPSGNVLHDSPDAKAFRAAAMQLATAFQVIVQPVTPPKMVPLDLQGLRDTIIGKIDPMVTVPARLQYRIQLAKSFNWSPPDPITPIMAAPSFPQPMYYPLRDISKEWVLPGLKDVPQNSLSLVETDDRFIESYMVGLNCEMARQLLWNGFPTDQRGSYFRQFWDVSSYVPTADDLKLSPKDLQEKLYDIPPIHTWFPTNSLGENMQNKTGLDTTRTIPNPPQNLLVLLVRGELLQRYPNAIIYACKAVWTQTTDDNGRQVWTRQPSNLTSDEMHPVIRGTLPLDVTYFGFDISVKDAYGSKDHTQNYGGWFFVIQEHPTEPKFGLELTHSGPVYQWADLSWDIVPIQNGYASVTGSITSTDLQIQPVIDDKPIPPGDTRTPDNPNDPNNSWGKDAAQTAYITIRRPARVAIHADTMLNFPPLISISSPSDLLQLDTQTITVTGSAADSVFGVQKVEVSIDGGEFNLANGTTSWKFNTSPLSDGVHTVTAKVTNQSGDTATTSVTVTINTQTGGAGG
ncbi:hypothetical protein DYY66_1985 [Candidatus Nitrosotalea sp. FS]|uniref:Ig-like domain-containing protein n=1 Tax=Candidatus Nitrosotalea sp. FS TaxID=2341021 RepID=UPI00140903EF|nr:Ig-like domain-containing protein [Candidatus Nitrosotalea sp. FS]NHH98692.1 hypothetical protein [Candidatus Nitrosotalea sp. FS]